MSAVRQSPLESAVQVPLATTVPSPVGGQDSMRQVPLDMASKSKPCRWKMQPGWGSLARIGSFSSGSWTFSVPLKPGAPLP
jgi:hypothetical protein